MILFVQDFLLSIPGYFFSVPFVGFSTQGNQVLLCWMKLAMFIIFFLFTVFLIVSLSSVKTVIVGFLSTIFIEPIVFLAVCDFFVRSVMVWATWFL